MIEQELLLELISAVGKLTGEMGELRAEVRNNTAITTEVKNYQQLQNGRVFALADRVNARNEACPLVNVVKSDIAKIQIDAATKDEHRRTVNGVLAVVWAVLGGTIAIFGKGFVEWLVK